MHKIIQILFYQRYSSLRFVEHQNDDNNYAHFFIGFILNQSLLDNSNERILYGMLFRYLENRGYYDVNAPTSIQTWSDEEDEREKRQSSVSEPIKSTTLRPNNILKVINK